MIHIDHLAKLLPLDGQLVVDIGAGDGALAGLLYAAGARVTAVECDPAQVARARESLPPEVDVRQGVAEALPLDDDAQTLACLFFSLHHVPASAHPAAFDEVCRVLRPGGRLHVVEPYAHGSMFDVVRFVEDETLVRTQSHAALARLAQDPRFRLIDRSDYVLTRAYSSFDALVDKVVRLTPERMAQFAINGDRMRAAYDAAIDTSGALPVLHQPCAAFHFALTD